MIEGRWVNDDERIVWLAAFGAGAAQSRSNAGIATAVANAAVDHLRGLEPEIPVVELAPEQLKAELASGWLDASNHSRVQAATYRGRRGFLWSDLMQPDGSTKSTFYCVKGAESTG